MNNFKIDVIGDKDTGLEAAQGPARFITLDRADQIGLNCGSTIGEPAVVDAGSVSISTIFL